LRTTRRLFPAACLAGLASACRPVRHHGEGHTPILLFAGTGTSRSDVGALEDLLRGAHLAYETASSDALARMTDVQLRRYRLLLVPGGNFEQLGNALTPSTTAAIRDAVRSGLNYLGICAGAFFAGNSPYNGLNLTSGVRFGFYSAEAQGIRKTVVPILTPDGRTLDHYWEDGPQLSGWGKVVARYPDGAPAIVQGVFGAGRVVLTGTHPEAPGSWRDGMRFRTAVEETQAYTRSLIVAALNGEPLPHF
jgi:glutamine amidotransferase-like uncharacterized protein